MGSPRGLGMYGEGAGVRCLFPSLSGIFNGGSTPPGIPREGCLIGGRPLFSKGFDYRNNNFFTKNHQIHDFFTNKSSNSRLFHEKVVRFMTFSRKGRQIHDFLTKKSANSQFVQAKSSEIHDCFTKKSLNSRLVHEQIVKATTCNS